MNGNAIKFALTAALAALGAYLGQLAVPIIVLLAVMLVDYATGMAKAWTTKTLSSRVGIGGILKKVGYLVIVLVAAVIDWLLLDALVDLGVTVKLDFLFSLLVTVWLIINELISILENVAAIGAPVPDFLVKLSKRLQQTVANRAAAAMETGEEIEDDEKTLSGLFEED